MQITRWPVRLFLAAVAGIVLVAIVVEPNVLGSWLSSIKSFIQEQQRYFTRELGTAVRNLRETPGQEAVFSLMGLSFLYGVFHAAGPGHGKMVISAYALTQDSPIRRTVAISAAAAVMQGITAIVAVGGIALLVEGSLRRAVGSVDDVMEPISYGAVTLVGGYLAFAGARLLYRSIRGAATGDHTHSDSCGCSHNHMPTDVQLRGVTNWWEGGLVAISVGLRPCSGAVLVLILSFLLGSMISGVAAVAAMSLGTAITVAAMASAARGLRWPVENLLTGIGLRAAPVGGGFAFAGGAIIIYVGASLFVDSFNRPTHPFM